MQEVGMLRGRGGDRGCPCTYTGVHERESEREREREREREWEREREREREREVVSPCLSKLSFSPYLTLNAHLFSLPQKRQRFGKVGGKDEYLVIDKDESMVDSIEIVYIRGRVHSRGINQQYMESALKKMLLLEGTCFQRQMSLGLSKPPPTAYHNNSSTQHAPLPSPLFSFSPL